MQSVPSRSKSTARGKIRRTGGVTARRPPPAPCTRQAGGEALPEPTFLLGLPAFGADVPVLTISCSSSEQEQPASTRGFDLFESRCGRVPPDPRLLRWRPFAEMSWSGGRLPTLRPRRGSGRPSLSGCARRSRFLLGTTRRGLHAALVLPAGGRLEHPLPAPC